ncbi:MAG: amidase, partial [Thermocrispum sp.]
MSETEPSGPVHAFTDDVLADHDAVALAALIRDGQVSPVDVAEAAVARVSKVNPVLNAVQFAAFERAVESAGQPAAGPLSGVPFFVKDNTDVAGMPTGNGTAAYTPRPAVRDGDVAEQLLSAGFTVLGKSTLPEFGLNATTEYADGAPTRNPWHTGYSVGASSGGAAALVASGAVPIAHANDGGGSIRIPAAINGLVGLKPTRGRHVDGPQARSMPLNIVSEGVLTRSVRDTAAFWAAAEQHWRNPRFPALGLVSGPAQRRLHVGLITRSVSDAPIDAATASAVQDTVVLLEKLGHTVEPVELPVGEQFVDDFITYWGFLAFTISAFGKRMLDKGFDSSKLDGFTHGLRRRYQRNLHRSPRALYRLSRVKHDYARMFERFQVIVSPVLAHSTPELGYLSPTVPFDDLLHRLHNYVAFTPLNNVAGGPALSLPLGQSERGMPIGVHFAATHGDE